MMLNIIIKCQVFLSTQGVHKQLPPKLKKIIVTIYSALVEYQAIPLAVAEELR